MGITIGSNIASLRAQRKLGQTSNDLSSTFERLSSGQRINKASDDAAGLAIADSLRANSRVYSQALRNIADGMSVLTIAEGALRELSGLVTRHMELAEQAANGVYTLAQRKALDGEANALVEEYNRIAQTTVFNGVNLLSGDNSELRLQLGYGIEESLRLGFGDEFKRNGGTGFFDISSYNANGSRGVAVGDLNGNGHIDFISANYNPDDGHNISVHLNNGDGTFQAGASYACGTRTAGGRQAIALGDFNGDGKLDIADHSADGYVSIFYGHGNGTFQARESFAVGIPAGYSLKVADLNGDGRDDLSSGFSRALINNGNGGFGIVTGLPSFLDHHVVDIDGDGVLDLAGVLGDPGVFMISLGNGDGTFRTPTSISTSLPTSAYGFEAADFNNDGSIDLLAVEYDGAGNSEHYSIALNKGDGSFNPATTYKTVTWAYSPTMGDMNGDGIPDLVLATINTNLAIHFGNGDGTFQAAKTNNLVSGASYDVAVADFNGDGALDAVTGLSNKIALAKTEKVSDIGRLYLLSQEGAREALETSRRTLERITMELGVIGGLQSRLQSAANVLTERRLAQTAAESSIRDADIASESAKVIRHGIIQQAAAAVLSQANQQPALAIQLLRT